jgi:sugar phosphate isomerase/epimerase
MKLSLSVRVAESFTNKEKSTVPFPSLVALAKKYGFSAMCLRASVAGIHTPLEVVRAYRRQLDAAALAVSMSTGDFAVPVNGDAGPDGLRWITPYLDLATELKAPLLRVCMKVDEDIYWAQRAADEARERGIRLAHQSHTASMFESPESALAVLKKVNRANFGLIYEAANWFVAGEKYGPDAIEMIRPYLFNVYVQNHRLNAKGAASLVTWKKGNVGVDHIGIWEKDGVNYDLVLTTLARMGYDGYVTIHQAFAGVMPVEESIRRSVDYLRRF